MLLHLYFKSFCSQLKLENMKLENIQAQQFHLFGCINLTVSLNSEFLIYIYLWFSLAVKSDLSNFIQTENSFKVCFGLNSLDALLPDCIQVCIQILHPDVTARSGLRKQLQHGNHIKLAFAIFQIQCSHRNWIMEP